MDAGTVVALVLGAVGFGLSGVTLYYNRRDVREARWVQEKRVIYARTQAALMEQYDAMVRFMKVFNLDGSTRQPAEFDDAQTRTNESWDGLRAVRGELDLLAPGSVRAAVEGAQTALFELAWALPGDDEEQSAAMRDAERQNARALNAMRADLGLKAIDLYTASDAEIRLRLDQSGKRRKDYK
ncbi:MAG: hypothetical protein NVV70_18015 [Cellulomonas sp.]|nr:hypothetical protein [Cellulomonas sp.]MCR6649935.1 hypothetical protein [Cellulomonas sp.]